MDPAITRHSYEEPARADAMGVVAEQRPLPTLEGVLNTLRRRRWLIVAIALLGTGAALFAGSRLKPKYTAVSLIELEQESASIPDLKLVFNAAGEYAAAADAAVLTQIQRLSSRDHMRRVAAHLDAQKLELGTVVAADEGDDAGLIGEAGQNLASLIATLWSNATAALAESEGDVPRVLSEAAQYLTDWLSERSLPAADAADQTLADASAVPQEPGDDTGSPEQDPAASPDAVASGLAKDLQVRQQGDSYVISVSYTSEDPDTAAKVANSVVDLYVEEQVQRNRARAIGASAWLGKRVAALKREVESAEAALELYRVANNIAVGGTSRLNDLQLVDLSRELITARAELSGLRARLGLAVSLRNQGQTPDTMLEVLSSPLIIDLRRQESELSRTEGELSATLGPKHPRMVLLEAEKQELTDRIAIEINRIVTQMENEERIAAEGVDGLEASLAAAQAAMEQMRSAELGLIRLERDAETSRRHYQRFLDRYYEAQEQQQIVDSGIRVISAAVPPKKASSPGLPLFAVMGFTLSTMAGAMLAFLLDRFDNGLRSDSEVQSLLGAPRIGLIPKLGRRQRPPHRYLLARPRSVYAEAIREVLTDCHLNSGVPSKVLAITSSVPAEGKSTLSISLALCAAQTGLRVMLIDLDLRHPALSRVLGFRRMHLGIVDYILDQASLAQVITRDQHLGFDIIASGRMNANPTPVLTSERLGSLVEILRDRYDIIIVDSPPVLGITDARLFIQHADIVPFVVQWGKTPASVAQNATKLLRRAGANIAGIVLSQANVKQHARYGYGDTGAFYNQYRRYYQG